MIMLLVLKIIIVCLCFCIGYIYLKSMKKNDENLSLHNLIVSSLIVLIGYILFFSDFVNDLYFTMIIIAGEILAIFVVIGILWYRKRKSL